MCFRERKKSECPIMPLFYLTQFTKMVHYEHQTYFVKRKTGNLQKEGNSNSRLSPSPCLEGSPLLKRLENGSVTPSFISLLPG